MDRRCGTCWRKRPRGGCYLGIRPPEDGTACQFHGWDDDHRPRVDSPGQRRLVEIRGQGEPTPSPPREMNQGRLFDVDVSG